MFSEAATTVPPSGIRQVVEVIERALDLGDVTRLEIGEPNFPTPAHIVEAADRAVREGRTRMTAAVGLPELRRALAERVSGKVGTPIEADQVIVTNGSTQALYLALASALETGDEVLVPDPGYPSYAGMVVAAGGSLVRYRLTESHGFLPDVDELAQAVTERTRVILVNSPGNPTGAVIDARTMQHLLDLAAERDLLLLCDEVYDELTFTGRAVSAWQLEHRDRAISTFSMSKTYAMTGWRLGYAVVPKRAVSPLSRMHSAMMSCISTPLQWAGLAAVQGPQDAVQHMRDQYRQRRDLALNLLAGSSLRTHTPDGAFYLWINVASSGRSGKQFAWDLLENRRVAVAPGTAFGPAGEDYIRVSLAADPQALRRGLQQILAEAGEPTSADSGPGGADRASGTDRIAGTAGTAGSPALVRGSHV